MTDCASLVVGFAPGAIGGVCNVLTGHPIDLVKVRFQTKISSATTADNTFSALRNIVLTEGVPGLYRGVLPPLLAVIPAFAISFWSYDAAKTAMQSRMPQGELSLGHTVLAGGFSGVPLAFVVGPSERIKCLMQVDKQRYSSFTDCARQVYKEGGLRSVFRGCGATMLRDVPGNAAYFGLYEYTRRQLAKIEGTATPSLQATFCAGGLAGVGNWIVAIPFDVLKSRYQTAPPSMYRGVGDVLKDLLHREGFRALFRGLSPALIRAFPANGACLAGVETARNLVSSEMSIS